MKLSEIKQYLATVTAVLFKLPDGTYVPEHFHITEVGAVMKHFIDCGGTQRIEKAISFQLWDANDYDHRLKPQKLLNIIRLSEKQLGIGDGEVEVEYQKDTIGKYGLDFDGKDFLLTAKKTACLAKDACGITPNKVNHEAARGNSGCLPGSGCC